MAKAFESLFGSVTCLPGCFTLYRLRTPDTHKPLLISNQLVTDYSENRVDTLHMKNLLHLGEDRYLTTLLLKHFPLFKTQFVRDAHAYTVAPDDWKVLLSQRRRWINSTVHNLGELVFLEQLCGFCCFSMRFIVMIDLLSTIIQPVSVAYVSFFVTLLKHYLFSLLSRLSICYISSSDKGNLFLRCHWSWLRPFTVFKFWSSSWDGSGIWLAGWSSISSQSRRSLSSYLFTRSGEWTTFLGDRLVWFLESPGRRLSFMYVFTFSLLQRWHWHCSQDEGKFDPRSIPLKSWNDYVSHLLIVYIYMTF